MKDSLINYATAKQTNKNKRLQEKKKKKSIWLLQFVTAFQQSQYYLLCCLLIEASKKPQKGTSPLTYQIKMIAHSLKYCAVIPLGGILFEMGCDATILGNKENSLKPNSFLNTWSIHDRSYFMFDVCGIFSFFVISKWQRFVNAYKYDHSDTFKSTLAMPLTQSSCHV